MLYFGSFNPIHNGHIALAEYAIEQKLCDELIMIVSPQNPLKESRDLAPEVERFNMAVEACAESKYPEQIKASLIELMLEKPSYTINTLRHLSENYGDMMNFSILMGSDIIPQLHLWREYEAILDSYPIYVYPREEVAIDRYLDRVQPIINAPLMQFSSTEVRKALQRGESIDNMTPASVVKHIKELGLWSPESYINALNAEIESSETPVNALLERGMWHYRHNDFGKALNDFNRAIALDANNSEAQQMAQMVKEILAYRYTDIYNP